MVIYTISQINNLSKDIIENKFDDIWIKGEITSKNTYNTSGHTYFTIIDENSELSAVSFSGENNSRFIEIGKNVILSGRLSIYTTKGRFQFICKNIYAESDGRFWLKYQKLKKKLELEGIFSKKNKFKIPLYPQKIGIITSKNGSVLWDMINFFKTQKINLEIIINNTSVQGEKSIPGLINGIDNLNKIKVDIIIIARGGGTIEDLWCFNNESLVRKIYSNKIPIISAIGHETDYTLTDFVSDYRAPTPSFAAEKITRSLSQINLDIDNYIKIVYDKINYNIKNYNDIVKNATTLLKFENILNILNRYNLFFNFTEKIIKNKINTKLERLKSNIEYYEKIFQNSNPEKKLKKGYILAYNESNDIISSVSKIKRNQLIDLKFHDGNANVLIKKIKNEK